MKKVLKSIRKSQINDWWAGKNINLKFLKFLTIYKKAF